MKATLLLCDAAQVADGKLFILGGGWSVTGPYPVASAVALKLEVPWDQSTVPHHWELFLADADGKPVTVAVDGGQRPVEVGGDFTLERPPGLPPGAPLDVPIAVNLPPLPLPPGGRFEWRLVVDGEENEHWALRFTTRSLPEGEQPEAHGPHA